MRRRDCDRPHRLVSGAWLLGSDRGPARIGRGGRHHGDEQPGGQRERCEQDEVAEEFHVGARKNGVRIADNSGDSAQAFARSVHSEPEYAKARLQCSTCDSSGERCAGSRSCSWSSRSSSATTSPMRLPCCHSSWPASFSSCRTRSCCSPSPFLPASSACSRSSLRD